MAGKNYGKGRTMNEAPFITSWLLFLTVMFFWWLYYFSDRFYIFVQRLQGKQVIYVEGITSAIKGERWYAIVHHTPFGQMHAYRYPAGKIGIVNLCSDGTGEYCGKILWVKA